MNAKTLYYYDGDPPAIVEVRGYGIVKDVNGHPYKMGVFRKTDEPDYSVVDCETGYRYRTGSRTLHGTVNYIKKLNLRMQPPIKGLKAYEQVARIRGAYDGVPWEENFWNPDNPDGYMSAWPGDDIMTEKEK